MKSLRRRLFASHLLVMVVAVTVIVVSAAAIIGLSALSGEGFAERRGPEPGSPNPLILPIPVVAALSAAGAVSWVVARRIAEPLEQIGRTTQQLAGGEYRVRVAGSDIEELDELASNVNSLAAELASIEERRRRLIGDVAHELRNPLAAIEGSMEALMDGLAPATIETYARIGREAARLRRLATDLAELSSAGELDNTHLSDDIDVDALLRHTVELLRPQADAKAISFEVELGHDPAPVIGDADRLAQVFTNVIGNAIQYSDRGTISVRSSRTPHAVRIEVTDEGHGLEPDDAARVFERFFRVDGRLSDGTGVGLPIARSIVEAHAGSISVRSQGVGTGSTFIIELPTINGHVTRRA